MLRWRILLGTLIVAVLAVLGWLDLRAASPGVSLLPALIAFTLLGSAEVLYLARAGGMRPWAWPVYLGNLAIVLGSWLPLAHAPAALQAVPSGYWMLGLALTLVFVGEMLRYERPGGIMANIGVSALALTYVGLMLDFAVRLRLGWGLGAMASWIIVVKMGDTGAYVFGRLFGRHKMTPRLSPGKTWEGAVGGLAASCLASWAVFRWLMPLTAGGSAVAVVSSPALGWLVYGLILGVVGMLGDLAESLVKRDVGCKDSSTWLPGFGGILDILDSLLLSAPVAWLCWATGLVG